VPPHKPDPDHLDRLASPGQLDDQEHQERTVPPDHLECKETPDPLDRKDPPERRVTAVFHKLDHLDFLDSPDYEDHKDLQDMERTVATANEENPECLDHLASLDHREPWAILAIAILRLATQPLLSVSPKDPLD